MAGLPKVIASRPWDRRRSQSPTCYCPRRRVSNRGHALTLTFTLAAFGIGTDPARAPWLDVHGSRVRGPLPRHRPKQSPGDRVPRSSDYETYLHRLAAYRARYAVTLHAYCL